MNEYHNRFWHPTDAKCVEGWSVGQLQSGDDDYPDDVDHQQTDKRSREEMNDGPIVPETPPAKKAHTRAVDEIETLPERDASHAQGVDVYGETHSPGYVRFAATELTMDRAMQMYPIRFSRRGRRLKIFVYKEIVKAHWQALSQADVDKRNDIAEPGYTKRREELYEKRLAMEKMTAENNAKRDAVKHIMEKIQDELFPVVCDPNDGSVSYGIFSDRYLYSVNTKADAMMLIDKLWDKFA